MDEYDAVADLEAEEVNKIEGAEIGDLTEENLANAVEQEDGTARISSIFVGLAVVLAILLAQLNSPEFNIFLEPIGMTVQTLVFVLGLFCIPIAIYTYMNLNDSPSHITIYAFLFSATVSGAVVFGVGPLFTMFIALYTLFSKNLINWLPAWKVM